MLEMTLQLLREERLFAKAKEVRILLIGNRSPWSKGIHTRFLYGGKEDYTSTRVEASLYR